MATKKRKQPAIAKSAPDEQPQSILAEAGISGLRQYGGYVREEWHPKLQGTLAVKVYREMVDNDAVIGGALLAMETLMRGVDWSVKPSNENKAEALREATFVDQCRNDMDVSWEEHLSEVLTMVPYGWALCEEVYKLRLGEHDGASMMNSNHNDGRIGWRTLALRGQDGLLKWDIDQTGRATAMIQQAEPDFKTRRIPLDRALLFRPRSHKNNPEGRSLLRNAYRSWYMLKRIQEIEGVGVERDLAGFPVMQVPPEIMLKGASQAQKDVYESFKKMVSEIRIDTLMGAVVPAEETADGKKTGYKLGLLTSGGRRPVDVNEIVKRYESRILISILCEFLVLGMDKVGSFALSSDKTDLFAMALGALLDAICAVYNRVAIPRLMRLNGVPRELWPTLEHGDIERQSLTEVVTALSTAANAGFDVVDGETSSYVRELASAPKRQVAAAVLASPTMPTQTPPPAPTTKRGKQRANATRTAHGIAASTAA